MEILISRSFQKVLRKLDSKIQKRIVAVVREVEAAESLNSISSVKPMHGYPNYYRIREGDYRIGIFINDENIIEFLDIGSRGDFYKKFP